VSKKQIVAENSIIAFEDCKENAYLRVGFAAGASKLP
jgi:hypothetical protein